MASSLYVNIRGDYTQFQKDMNELRGIARKSAVAVSEAFEHAFSPKLFKSGLQQVGLAIKSLNASASKMGTVFEPTIARLSDLAKACSVSEKHMQSLVNRMAEAAHQRQLENSLRTLQRQLNLTNSELAKMQREAGDTAGSVNTSLKSIGVRSTAALRNEIIEVANAFSQIELSARTTKENTQRYLEAMREKTHQLRREMMTATERKRDDYNQLVSKYTTATPTTKGFEAYSQMVKLKEAMSSFQEVNGRLPRTVAEMRQLGQATGATVAQVRSLRDELQKSSGFFNTIIESVKQKVFYGLIAGLGDSVRTAMRLENVEVAFTAIYGTAEMAGKKLEYVRQVSDELGLSFMDTAEGAKKLFAAAQGTPVEKDANMVFKAFSDMSAALKLTGDETKGVFLALSQMISKGKVSAEELRQQLAERMPGAVNMFARAIGKTTQDLDKMLQKGEVTLEHFIMFSREVQNTYGPGAIAAGGSLQAELNRLYNTYIDFQKNMADTNTLAPLVKTINTIAKTVTPAFEAMAKHVGAITATGFGAWLGASASAGGKLNAKFAALGDTFNRVKDRIEAFNKGVAIIPSRASGAAGAIGKLKAGLGAIGSNVIHAGIMAVIALMGSLAYSAYQASKAFQNARKSMSEYVADAVKSKEDMEAANFTPASIRQALVNNTAEKNSDWEKEVERIRGNVDRHYQNLATQPGSWGMFSGSAQETSVRNALESMVDFRKKFNEAIEKEDVETAKEIYRNAFDAWNNGFKQAVQAAGGSLGQQLDNMGGKNLEDMSGIIANTDKQIQTFSNNYADAAKRLEMNTEQMASDLKKIKDAAEKTDLGKAMSGMEAMEKLKAVLNDTSIAFTSNAKDIVAYSEQLKNHASQVVNATQKYEQHVEAIERIKNVGPLTQQQYRDLQSEQKALAGESTAVAKAQQELKDWVVNCANAAGGSKIAYDTMVAVLKAVGGQCQSLSGFIQGLISDIYELSEAGARALARAQGLSIMQGAKMQFFNTEAQQAFEKRDFKKWSAIIRDREFSKAEANGKRFVATNEFNENLKGAWDYMTKNADMQKAWKEAHKKGGGGGGGKRVDNTQEKYHSAEEGWRKKIADMQGQKDIQTLAKDFADMDKQLKGSSVDMKALKKDYLEAFSTKYATDLNKEILQLRGNEAELARIDIEEKYKAKAAAIEGMAEEAKKLGVTVADQTPKLAEYRKLLEGQAREQQLEKELPYYEKFSWFDGMKSEALAKQNELIAIQAEKMKGTIPDELIERWKELEELQNRVKNGNDVLAGVALGAKKYALEMGNLAENVSDLVQKSFDDMADAFTDMVMTGKASFTDLANSIIKDLMRIAIKQAIIGPIANGIGSLFGGLFNFGGGAMSSAKSAIQSGVSATAAVANIHLAHGGVLSGLHGYSNQIVNRPTLFSYGSQLTKFAKGGVMGEAGPEAVMPLTRTASGHLGVRSDSGNAPIVNVVINNATGQQASQQTKTDNQGNKSIEVMIGDMAAQQMMKTGTALNKAARSFSGVEQQVVRR